MADADGTLADLEDVVDRIESLAEDQQDVSVADIQKEIGRRSFGPLLVVFGVMVLTPLGGIPGVPSLFGVIVLLISGQVLLGQDHFWLPGALTRRSVKADRLRKSAGKARPVARWVDALLRPRLVGLTQGPAGYGIAVACVILACTLPFLEIVPLGAIVPAVAITAFGLALIAQDGAFALLGYAAAVAALILPVTVL